MELHNFTLGTIPYFSFLDGPSQKNVLFPIAPPTQFFGKIKKKKSRIAVQEASI